MYSKGSGFGLCLDDPVCGLADKARGNSSLSVVKVQRNHPGIGIKRAIGVAQPDLIGKFHGQLAGKQRFTGRAKFDDRGL